MSSHGRSVFPSCYHRASPRLPLLSQSPSTTTLTPPALVVHSPSLASVWSCSPSLGPLTTVRSALNGSGSPPPSWSPSPSTGAVGESKGSPGNIMIDSANDHLHDYPTPISMGPNLFIHTSPFGGLLCPVCPNRMPCGWNEANARAHVLAKACGL
jgi:hypothetical protein